MSQRPQVAYLPGAFDLFHIGHLNIIRLATKRCVTLIVGVVRDERLREIKGLAPVIPHADRLEIVSSLRVVRRAVLEHPDGKVAQWHEAPFDVLYKGDDWRGTVAGNRLEQIVASVGARVEYLPYTPGVSTSRLRMELQDPRRAAAIRCP